VRVHRRRDGGIRVHRLRLDKRTELLGDSAQAGPGRLHGSADACPAYATADASDAPATDARPVAVQRQRLVLYQRLDAC
jgi:hypothetical protein